MLAEAVAASPSARTRWRPSFLRGPFPPKAATVLAPVKDASRRCRGGLQAILDRRCARWLAAPQVGTGGWPTRSNKGMAMGWMIQPQVCVSARSELGQFHFQRRRGLLRLSGP